MRPRNAARAKHCQCGNAEEISEFLCCSWRATVQITKVTFRRAPKVSKPAISSSAEPVFGVESPVSLLVFRGSFSLTGAVVNSLPGGSLGGREARERLRDEGQGRASFCCFSHRRLPPLGILAKWILLRVDCDSGGYRWRPDRARRWQDETFLQSGDAGVQEGWGGSARNQRVSEARRMRVAQVISQQFMRL